MNLFALKTERRIVAGVAAFFLLLTAAFTFEPLYFLLLNARHLPAGTTAYFTAAPASRNKPAYFSEIMKTIPPSHGWAANVNLLNNLKDLIFGFNVTEVTIQPWSVEIETTQKTDEVVTAIRRHLSKLTPFEIKTTLPDNTQMTEFIIDPELITVRAQNDNQNSGWIFTQTTPQLFVKNNGSTSIINLNYPQPGDKQSVKTLKSCHFSPNGLVVVTFDPQPHSRLGSIFINIFAYLKDYSCFQSFSTLN